jgi:hypothetical protein
MELYQVNWYEAKEYCDRLAGREVGDRIELIAGERRLICAKKLGVTLPE